MLFRSDVFYQNFLVSSTFVKELIVKKDFETVKRLLVKPYFVMGTVIEGKKLGRTIGFPTANLLAHENKLLPKDGVYLTKTYVDGKMYHSVTNIGKNPTVQGTCTSIESHLIDFNELIYGENIKIEFIEWVRHEVKFNSIEELKYQIHQDVSKVEKFLK